ncbi:unnamed protein product, partial [Laminaria digitata]
QLAGIEALTVSTAYPATPAAERYIARTGTPGEPTVGGGRGRGRGLGTKPARRLPLTFDLTAAAATRCGLRSSNDEDGPDSRRPPQRWPYWRLHHRLPRKGSRPQEALTPSPRRRQSPEHTVGGSDMYPPFSEAAAAAAAAAVDLCAALPN